MINKKTILVLGAGASMDYGFPSGKHLIEDIINFLHGQCLNPVPEVKKACVALILKRYYANPERIPDKEELSKLAQIEYCYDKVTKFTNELISASPASIDDFINKNNEEGFDIIGKICIVLMISMYENEEEFFFIKETKTPENHRLYRYIHPEINEKLHWELKDGWYQYLWSKIYTADDIRDALKNIVFISPPSAVKYHFS